MTMITTTIFDFDGTLVNTEHLKAVSYARAATKLDPSIPETDILRAYKDVVGWTREAIGTDIVRRFQLSKPAGSLMEEFKASSPVDAYIALRIRIYDRMLLDEALVTAALWPYTIPMLDWARDNSRSTGLATMSHRPHAFRLLDFLDLRRKFDFIATREDVEKGKPDPEIYALVASKLNTPAVECLVIEDSTAGVQAALSAGMHVLAICTSYTREALYQSRLLPPDRIIDDPAALLPTLSGLILKPQG